MNSAGPEPRVVFADADLLVVDKPSGVPSVPARTPLDPPDVATVLRGAHGPLEAVHRLDRDTSGLLVLARTPAARAGLGRGFESRTVVKTYVAVVHGLPPRERGEIHLPLAADPVHPPRQRADPILGRRAATRWRIVATAVAMDGPVGLLELEPLTGRSHQLRAHLAWLGCPVVGDRLYARRTAAVAPLALHAVAITFPHPRTGRSVALTAPPPTVSPWTLFAAGG